MILLYKPNIAFSTWAVFVPGESFTKSCDAEFVLSHCSQSSGLRMVFSNVAREIKVVNVKSVFSYISFTMPVTVVCTVSLK